MDWIAAGLRGWQWGALAIIAALTFIDHPPCLIGVAVLIGSAWIARRAAHDRETARTVQRNMRKYIEAGGLDR